MPNTALLLFKIVFLIVLFLYILFSLVIFNQARTMQKIINQQPLGTILVVISLAHLFLTLSLFVYTLVIL